jgi:hypothetical protein
VNRVCFFRFVCVVEFLAALAVRVIDAFNAETLYCGGVLCTVLRISYRRCCLRGRRIDPVRSAFVSGIFDSLDGVYLGMTGDRVLIDFE